MLRTLIVSALLFALPASASAQTASQCLSEDEASGLVIFALPATIKGLSRQCEKTLPATSTLVQGGPVMAARYQIDADKAWPVARRAIGKLTVTALAEAMTDNGARTVASEIMESAIAQQIKPKDCDTVERIVDALEPLPARNLASLLLALVEAGSKRNPENSPFNLCRSDKR